MKHCIFCGELIPGGIKKCPICAESFDFETKECPYCRELIPIGAVTCPVCAEDVTHIEYKLEEPKQNIPDNDPTKYTEHTIAQCNGTEKLESSVKEENRLFEQKCNNHEESTFVETETDRPIKKTTDISAERKPKHFPVEPIVSKEDISNPKTKKSKKKHLAKTGLVVMLILLAGIGIYFMHPKISDLVMTSNIPCDSLSADTAMIKIDSASISTAWVVINSNATLSFPGYMLEWGCENIKLPKYAVLSEGEEDVINGKLHTVLWGAQDGEMDVSLADVKRYDTYSYIPLEYGNGKIYKLNSGRAFKIVKLNTNGHNVTVRSCGDMSVDPQEELALVQKVQKRLDEQAIYLMFIMSDNRWYLSEILHKTDYGFKDLDVNTMIEYTEDEKTKVEDIDNSGVLNENLILHPEAGYCDCDYNWIFGLNGFYECYSENGEVADFIIGIMDEKELNNATNNSIKEKIGEINARGDKVVATYNEDNFKVIFYLKRATLFEYLYEALVKYDIEESKICNTLKFPSKNPIFISDVEIADDNLIMILDPNGCGVPWFSVVKYNMRTGKETELLTASGSVEFNSARTNIVAVVYEEFFNNGCCTAHILHSKKRNIYNLNGNKISSEIIETPKVALKVNAKMMQNEIVICMLDSKWANDDVSGYFYYTNDSEKKKTFFIVANSDSWGRDCMRIYDGFLLDNLDNQYSVEMNIDGKDYPIYFENKNDENKLRKQWVHIWRN